MEWKYWEMGEDSGSLANTSYLWSLNELFNIPLEYLCLILLWQDFISFGKTQEWTRQWKKKHFPAT